MVNIIEYDETHYGDFRRLNLEWLEKYHLAETHDLEILDDPQRLILDGGGAIYMAQIDQDIVGTAALIKTGDGLYELAKMAVTQAWQGRGISKLLMEKCLDTARLWRARKLSLYSNSQLRSALKLYEKYGFHHVPVKNSPFLTADVRMELILPDHSKM